VQFAIRPYRPEDFHTLWEIDQSCFPAGISYSQFELKTYILRRSAFTLVAEEHLTSELRGASDLDRILGFLVGDRTPRGRGHIITIDVRERARRFGIGSVLVQAAEERFRNLNCSVVRLETAVDNVEALSFYKRHGYSVIKVIPRYYSNGVDALLLGKHLQSAVAPDTLLR
jgi:ribosomal-protein-alanine N-acetyltransferase